MSEIKYDNEKNVCACDKFSFLLDDYESERLAHEATKRELEQQKHDTYLVTKEYERVSKELEELKLINKIAVQGLNDALKEKQKQFEDLTRLIQFVIPKTQVSLFSESVKSPRAHKAIIGCINKMTAIIESSRGNHE
ncbi:MAG: hypothetical protein SH817_08480 [Leptospira sp.]|nr:hypothetical protein [Leptospira sp.]